MSPKLKIEISQDFSKVYPGASVGILALENLSIVSGQNLDETRQQIILSLQGQFPDRDTLKNHPVIKAYSRYYKRFNKSYHVLGQLESVVFENRPLPSGLALVEAVFAAELKNMLLTAMHDLDAIRAPLEIGISTGEEVYTTLSGSDQHLKFGDMLVRDQAGVLSCVVYGPDQRTKVTPATSNLLVVVYAPEGIGKEHILSHFGDIQNYLRIFSPGFTTSVQDVYPQDLKR